MDAKEFNTVLSEKEWAELRKDGERMRAALQHDFKTKMYVGVIRLSLAHTPLHA